MAAALLAAIAVQALFAMALLSARVHHKQAARETIFYLPLARHPRAAAKPGRPSQYRKAAPAHRPVIAAPSLSPPSAALPAPSLQALHGLLFACGPDQALTHEDRKHCETVAGAPVPDAAAATRIGPERAHDPAHWARALARKQAPPLLPCASPYGIGVSLYTLYCLGKGAIEGFDLDAQPGYFDMAKPIHIPNNGDPGPLYQPIHE